MDLSASTRTSRQIRERAKFSLPLVHFGAKLVLLNRYITFGSLRHDLADRSGLPRRF